MLLPGKVPSPKPEMKIGLNDRKCLNGLSDTGGRTEWPPAFPNSNTPAVFPFAVLNPRSPLHQMAVVVRWNGSAD